MQDLERRTFLRGIGALAIAAPCAAARFVVEDKPKPLPQLQNGDVLSASYLNSLVNRVNELSNTSRL